MTSQEAVKPFCVVPVIVVVPGATPVMVQDLLFSEMTTSAMLVSAETQVHLGSASAGVTVGRIVCAERMGRERVAGIEIVSGSMSGVAMVK